MPRESLQSRKARAAKIIEGLRKAYPDAHCELEHSNALELLIATVLSAQCTDKKVNDVTRGLFRKYRTVEDYAEAKPRELEQDLRSIGLFRNKAKSVKSCCGQLLEEHGGKVPRTMDELTVLRGVGRKTANVVLGNAFGINVGVVVDTHVARLSTLLGLTREKTPEKIEKDLQKLVPREQWTDFSHWLIWHGRRRCPARRPDCAGCEIRVHCPAGQKALKEE